MHEFKLQVGFSLGADQGSRPRQGAHAPRPVQPLSQNLLKMMELLRPEAHRNTYLFDDEKPGVSVLNAGGLSPYVFTCDHASNRLPRRVGDLGLPDDQMLSHIAWDPGALDVATGLSAALDAPLVFSNYSRLVVDLNRPPSSRGHIPEASAGISIPANAALPQSEREARLHGLFLPYHGAISEILEARAKRSMPTMLVAVHSFTENYPGQSRPWHIGITHRFDMGLGAEIIRLLRERTTLSIGDNQPFQIDDVDDVTIPIHAEKRGLPNALIELRQDTLTDRRGIEEATRRLSDALVLAAPKTLGAS
jgi:predicted N-formylglutamate amidohydrolase